MRKPINILTGLDYWLDNLMCNVPELAMCYHDNGIVQVGSSGQRVTVTTIVFSRWQLETYYLDDGIIQVGT